MLQKNGRLTHGTLACIAALSLAAVSPTLQADEEAGNDALTEITVTAQRKSESLRDVPISVTAVSAQQMADFNIKTTDQLVLLTPGLTFDTADSYAQNYIRGIGSAFTNPGLEAAVATYVDGAYARKT